jgi:hypothetical protein
MKRDSHCPIRHPRRQRFSQSAPSSISARAFYGRPEKFLDPSVRRAQSAWGFLDEAQQEAELRRLRADLASGEWDRKHGGLRTQPSFFGALRLITATL